MTRSRVAGHATRAGTEDYAKTFGAALGDGHYSDFLNLHLRLSSLGLGTFPGAATDAVDAQYAAIVYHALTRGINVVDTASHYRYGRSERAVGEGLLRALAEGVRREQFFVISKGGFLTLPEGPPADLDCWFDTRIAANGLGRREDLAGMHLVSPEYIAWQIERSRDLLGIETLDAYLVDQPEVHIPVIGKERLNRKLLVVFEALERAVAENRIRCYGISTFNGFRVETDDPLFESLTSLLGLAEKAAQAVQGDPRATHGFRLIELPFNQAMPEGFTRFNQATGQGNVASTVQAARQLRIFAIASHTLMKGRLAQSCVEGVTAALPGLANDAQRAMQFNRSTPGVGVSLVGISTPAHFEDLMEVARIPAMSKDAYLGVYRRAG
jgi:aryl-alcohol dehydrogenase-like predicted oxidoreductase